MYPYKWQVRAKNHFQYLPSDVRIFYLVDISAPKLDQIDGNCSKMPIFTWAGYNGYKSYEFELATDSAFTNIVIPKTTVTGTTFTSTINLPTGQYYWRVRGIYINKNNNPIYSDYQQGTEIGSINVFNPVLTTPTGFNDPADGCIGGTYNFLWTSTANHTYEIEYSNDNVNWTSCAASGSSASSVISVSGTYSWRVRPTTTCNEKGDWVVAPNTFIVKMPIAPTSLSGPSKWMFRTIIYF